MVVTSELSGEALVSYVLFTGRDAVRLFGVDGVMAESALKRTYKALALRLHPDKNTQPGAHEAFQVLQQSFEATLAALQSTAAHEAATQGASPPTASSSWFTTPTAPPPPPPPFPAFAQSSLSGNCKSGQRESKCLVADNSLFEIPLPPDIFAECVTHDNPTPSETLATSRRTKPPEKRTTPLPTLDFSSSDDDHAGEAGNRQASRLGNDQERVNCSLNAERNTAQRKKRSVSRRTLMQLFAEFDISDDEEDKATIHHPTSNETDHHWEPPFGRESGQRQQLASGKPVSTRASAVVACPCCGAGVFFVHVVSGVVCPSCHAQFVPAAIGMMDAKCHATGRKKEHTLRGELCACGKASKGLCFLCD
ncbi:hypothetical protein TraAM80_01383 [Trypanosoma rangeli]|uniref:J domain-containing protein n=1 Tax=Trypanosoma rangeli TaxID=5698 RepID=A0A422NYZ7_TRYRA|nr:uncharacterized protein TraAM80_01383 [Trypanosoma rangeli]RNF10680.1 hypothetical protein TraAM80_01383 [Trypanosoma rangeli]|eukprot:RNF10680.1 hypothetical protein TraAM80_01383 [Trypanosoma rangeli]